jgi:hypothetical protein
MMLVFMNGTAAPKATTKAMTATIASVRAVLSRAGLIELRPRRR